MPIDKKNIARIEAEKRAFIRRKRANLRWEEIKAVSAESVEDNGPLNENKMGLHCKQLAQRVEDTRLESLFEAEFTDPPSRRQENASHHYLQGLSFLELAMREFKRASALCEPPTLRSAKAECLLSGTFLDVQIGTQAYAILREGKTFGNAIRDPFGNVQNAIQVPTIESAHVCTLTKKDLSKGTLVWLIDNESERQGYEGFRVFAYRVT